MCLKTWACIRDGFKISGQLIPDARSGNGPHSLDVAERHCTVTVTNDLSYRWASKTHDLDAACR